MRRIKGLLLFLLVVTIHEGLAQDRSSLIEQLHLLSPVPGSVEPDVLPTDGRPWIIFVFKACCSPAEHASRWIVDAQAQYGNRIGVLGINVDRSKRLQRVKNWLHAHDVQFPVLSDPTAQASLSWGVLAPPTIVILDGNANEVYRTIGYQAPYGATLTEKLETLLPPEADENAPADTLQ